MSKRILTILLCIFLVTQLCACAPKNTDNDKTPSATISTNKQDETEPTGNKTAGEETVFEGANVPEYAPLPDNNASIDQEEKSNYTKIWQCKVFMHDEANLLSDKDEKKILEKLEGLCGDISGNILFLTYDDAHGANTQTYTDTYLDILFPDEENNIAFIIDIDNREMYINTMGEFINMITDSEIDAALDAGFDYITNGQYVDCLIAMAESCFANID